MTTDIYAADVEVYDHLSASLTDEDLPFYRGLAVELGGPVLELACGTGRILLPLVAEVGSGAGVDLSLSMIHRAKEKAEKLGITGSVELQVGDMRSIDFGRTFPLVFAPYSSLFQLPTDDDLRRTLRNALHHTSSGGIVAADVFVPNLDNMKARQDRTVFIGEFPATEPSCKLIVWEHTMYDWKQSKVTRRRIYETVADDGYVTSRRHGRLVVYFRGPDAVLRTFKDAGWKIAGLYGDFDKRPFEPDSGRLVIVASA